MHGSVIVRSRHRAQLELPVIAAAGFALVVDDHGSDRLEAVGIGDIVRLQPLYLLPGQREQICQFLDSSDRAPLLTLDLFPILGQHNHGIFLRQFHKLFLGSFFRHPDIYSLFSPGSQPFFNNRSILYFSLEHDLLGNKRRPCIKLFDKTG